MFKLRQKAKKLILLSLFLLSLLSMWLVPIERTEAAWGIGTIKDLVDITCNFTGTNLCAEVTKAAIRPAATPTLEAVGSTVMLALASKVAALNPYGESLTEREKNFIRPYLGNIVDRVVIHYNASLVTDYNVQKAIVKLPNNIQNVWQPPDQKITYGDFIGQTFGNNIYIAKPHSTMFSLVALLAHEIVHSIQYERYGSLSSFGAAYFLEFSFAGFNYENNELEKEAYDLQYNKFTENYCAAGYFDGRCTDVYSFDFDYANQVPSFSLDGSGTVEVPKGSDTLSATNSKPVDLSETTNSSLVEMVSTEGGDYTSCLTEHLVQALVPCNLNTLPISSQPYDSSLYRPNTSGWTGRVGKLAFYNSTSTAVTVSLYHPDVPTQIFNTWTVEPLQNLFLGSDYYGMDWGLQVNNSPVYILDRVSAWNEFNGEYIFQAGYPLALHN